MDDASLSNGAYSIKIEKVSMYKFSVLQSGVLPAVEDKITSIDLRPQAHEITIYESIFAPVLKVDIAIIDYIGLFVNFPLTGNEIIQLEYQNVNDTDTRRILLAIESITDPTPSENSRAVGYIIKCVSIEALANGMFKVQKAYKGTNIEIAKQIFEEHINDRIKKFFPSFKSKTMWAEIDGTVSSTFVAPNVHPFNAINMVSSLAVSESADKNAYFFFENKYGFNFATLQGMTQGTNARRKAVRRKYKYFPMEVLSSKSQMQNEGRVVSRLTFNRRHGSMQKLAVGYFNNNLFEVNIAQKSYYSTRTKTEDVVRMFPHGFDTKAYIDNANSVIEGDEISNRTAYMLTTRSEDDKDFPVLKSRDRWGKDIISKIALAQVDVTVVIPGTSEFTAGDQFYIEIPEFHGFEDIKQDDLVSGDFLITEVKHIIRMGGFHSTVLRLNKDSYNKSPDRESRYV